MRRMLYWLSIATVVLTGSGCDSNFKYAAIDGVTGFITATISETLAALLPVADWINNANGTAQ